MISLACLYFILLVVTVPFLDFLLVTTGLIQCLFSTLIGRREAHSSAVLDSYSWLGAHPLSVLYLLVTMSLNPRLFLALADLKKRRRRRRKERENATKAEESSVQEAVVGESTDFFTTEDLPRCARWAFLV